MVYLQGCMRCNEGAVYLNNDQYGYYIECLTCGHMRDVNEIKVNGRRQPDMAHAFSLIKFPEKKTKEGLRLDPFISILIDLSRRSEPVSIASIQESIGLEGKLVEECLRLMGPSGEYASFSYVTLSDPNNSSESPKRFGIALSGQYVLEEYKAEKDKFERPSGKIEGHSIDAMLLDSDYTLTEFWKYAVSQSEILFAFIDHLFEILYSN